MPKHQSPKNLSIEFLTEALRVTAFIRKRVTFSSVSSPTTLYEPIWKRNQIPVISACLGADVGLCIVNAVSLNWASILRKPK